MHPLVELAKDAVEKFVGEGVLLEPSPGAEGIMPGRAGAFVCLKKHGQLRGCIGTIEPATENVASEVVRNAVAAATDDPRFSPVSAEELGELQYTVDVLMPPESVSSMDELDPVKYGVIVTSGLRRGLLLPDLEGVDTVEEQWRIAAAKAGIGPGEHEISIERFEVKRFR